MEISSRVEQCATTLGGWVANTFGDVKRSIRKKEEELEEWQNKAPDGVMINKCNELVMELDDLNRLHESYWFARACANEIRDGDKNTSYFHHKASQRKQSNTIHKIQDRVGIWKTNEDEVGEVINDYFIEIFFLFFTIIFQSHCSGSHGQSFHGSKCNSSSRTHR